MKENNMKAEPLLFIDTINNDNVIPKNQQLFDSRNKQIKIITKTHPQEFYVKLNRLVLMYNKNKKIICQVTLLTKEVFNVIVKQVDNNMIICINIDDMKDISFNINEIDELTIEQISYY
jgi:hypothetical protein